MFPIILVFILRESDDRSDNPTSRRNMNSRSAKHRKQPLTISSDFCIVRKHTGKQWM